MGRVHPPRELCAHTGTYAYEGYVDLDALFIAHDLSVMRHISDRVAVMYVDIDTRSTSRLS